MKRIPLRSSSSPPDFRSVALETNAVLGNRECPCSMDGEQGNAPWLEHSPQFSQPQVLHPLVDMREHAVVQDEVERLVRIWQWRLVFVTGKLGSSEC